MTEQTKLQMKAIDAIDEAIQSHQRQIEYASQKIAALRAQRYDTVAQLRSAAIDSGDVCRDEVSREPDGDLLWA